MTDQIMPLSDEAHRAAQSLLPWYVTGRLEAAEQARMNAHLAACSRCQADLSAERRLQEAVVGSPLESEPGWARLQGRLVGEARAIARGRRSLARGARYVRQSGLSWAGWAVAAALLAAWLIPRSLSPQTPAGSYHTLASAVAAPSGNLLVMFRPETPERELRAALQATSSRLVDGPTEGGVYVIHTPDAGRSKALAALRRRPAVLLAEPIGSAGAR